ncbi:MAG: HAMP domain-containing sensor histidine kinase [Acidimicrobiia bacterium]
MRRRLVLLALATAGLIVISFTIPLGLLVRQQASDGARLDAEREAQRLASLVALTSALSDDVDRRALQSAVEPLQPGEMVLLPDGTILGLPAPNQGEIAIGAASQQRTLAGDVAGGWELAVPVLLDEGTVVVSVYVSDAEMTEGVWAAWLLLGLLGGLIVITAVFVADRLGRSLVEPLDHLVESAHQLGSGELSTRVEASGPEEIEELGRTFNWLAARLEVLVAEEREAVADLSHELRTPLTSLRLQADRLADPEERQSLLVQVDRLEEEVDRLIERTRGDHEVTLGSCDASSVVLARADFWRVLAQDQGRSLSVQADGPIEVSLPERSVESIVDSLVGNVFKHTPSGTDLDLHLAKGETGPVLVVSDTGPGWPSSRVMTRGVSGTGSTGLGLDIARRVAESNGGSLKLDDRPRGGAVVVVNLGT